jgi:hypothetical protein
MPSGKESTALLWSINETAQQLGGVSPPHRTADDPSRRIARGPGRPLRPRSRRQRQGMGGKQHASRA